MLERLKAIIAYLGLVDKQGEILAEKSLQNIENVTDLPVTYNFDDSKVIGKIIEVTPKQNQLVATVEINKKFPIKDFVFRIRGRVIKEHKQKIDNKDIRVIDKFELLNIGLVPTEFDVYDKEQNKKDKEV